MTVLPEPEDSLLLSTFRLISKSDEDCAREELVNEARRWVGAPYAEARGVSLVAACYWSAHLLPLDWAPTDELPSWPAKDLDGTGYGLDYFMHPVWESKPGDVVVVHQHGSCAIVLDEHSMVYANRRHREVEIETRPPQIPKYMRSWSVFGRAEAEIRETRRGLIERVEFHIRVGVRLRQNAQALLLLQEGLAGIPDMDPLWRRYWWECESARCTPSFLADESAALYAYKGDGTDARAYLEGFLRAMEQMRRNAGRKPTKAALLR